MTIRGMGAVLAIIAFACCVIFASREVDRDRVKVGYYRTFIRCYNCSADGDNFANTRVDVQLPIGQTITDPKSVCPKCEVPLSFGR